MAEHQTPKPPESKDAAGFAETAMERALHLDQARDSVQAVNGLRNAVIWLAAETRAARLEQQDLPARIEAAVGNGGQMIANNVWDALRQ